MRRVAKSGSGLADIVTSAVYPVSCTNSKTCNKPISTTDATGGVTEYTYDPTHGGVLIVTAPAPSSGAVRPQTRYTYTPLYAWYKNSAGSIVQAPTPIYKLTEISTCRTAASCVGTVDEVKTTFGYQMGSSSVATNLLLTSVTQSSGNGSLVATTMMTYDDRGNRLTVDGPLAGTVDTIATRYDILRRVVGVVTPDPDGAGALKRRAARYTYRPDDQMTLVELGTVDGMSDPEWAALSVLEQVSSGYDSVGRKTSEALVSGGSTFALTNFSYDALERIECVAVRMNPATFGSPPASACTPGTAGAFGPDRITRRVYNAAGEVPNVQTGYGTTAQRNEHITTFSTNSLPVTITDARGNLTTFQYDGHDRLYRTYFPSPTQAGVSSTTDYEQLTYDAAGNVTQTRLRDGQTIGFGYDSLGRLQTKNLPGSEPDVTYGYDNLGHTTSVTTSAQSLTFGYDALGRLRTQQGPHGTLTSDYDPASRRTQLTWPDAFYVTYDYLVTGELTAVRENGAATGLGVLASFSYDNLGRRTTLTRGNGSVTSYGYASASRLQQLTQDLVATSADVTEGFTHSPAGQIATRTLSNDAYAWTENTNVTRTYAPNGLNQIASIGSTTVSWDTRGNVTNFGTGAYGYSSENLLTGAPESVTLAYDPLSRLYQTSSPAKTTRFAYDGDSLVAEYNESNQLQRRYVHGAGADEPLVWYEGTGTATRRWLHADERGSIVAISDASGSQLAVNRYDEHGVPAVTNAGRFQYTGQVWVAEVSLYYYKARFYSASHGRFLQTDPIGYAAGMNLYAYVRGDPINLRDPTGLQSIPTVPVTGTLPCYYCVSPDLFVQLYGISQEYMDRIYQAMQDALAQAEPPQGQSDECSIAPDVTIKVGLFAEVNLFKLGKIKAGAALNFFAFSFPLDGSRNYMTQGVGIGIKGTRLFGIPLGVGVDRESWSGGLNWDSVSWSASADSYSASSEGLGFSVGAIIGVDLNHLERLMNILVPCAH